MLSLVLSSVDEEQLQNKSLIVFAPTGEEAAIPLVHGLVGDLEGNGLVGVACKEYVLEVLVGRLHLLLI